MIPSPYYFEPSFTPAEFQKIGELSLRWSHTEHVIGNCLKTMLRLTDAEAVVMVFSQSLEQRLTKMALLAEQGPGKLTAEARFALDELMPTMRALQFVRNNVIHAIITRAEDGEAMFHLRSKNRSLGKEQVFSCEELTNYAAHAAMSLRIALGFKTPNDVRHPLPERPAIPEFLRSYFPAPKAQTLAGLRSPPQPSPV